MNALTHGRVALTSAPARSQEPSYLYGLEMVRHIFQISANFYIEAVRGRTNDAIATEHTRHFGAALLHAGRANVTVYGHANVDPMQSYVFMSNHQSLMDIPALFVALPNGVRMVTKEELCKIPVFGPAMLKAGIIPVDRKNRERAFKQLELAKDHLKNGVSVWVAPEGTRSRDGTLQPFKKGGFHTAMALQKPIVPVWIDGTREMMSAQSLIVTPNQHLRVVIGKPIDTHGFDKNNLEALMQRVRDELLNLKASLE